MPPVPVPKSNELIDRLRHLTDGPKDDFALRVLERDVQKLMKHDPTNAWMIKGMIGAHRRDENAVREAFGNALRFEPGNSSIVQNYVRGLYLVGQYNEALEMALELVERDGMDADFLRQTVRVALRAGAFRLAAEMNERVRRLKSEPEHSLDAMLEILDREDLSDEEIRARAKVVTSILRDRGLYIETFVWEVFDDVAGVNYGVNADPDKIADLNEQIADALCARFADPLNRAFVFGCRSTK